MFKLFAYLSIFTIFLLNHFNCQNLNKNDTRNTKNLAQFALMINTVTGIGITGFLKYNGYGCWCGDGGRGRPVDNTDRCCQTHDRCYDAAEMYGCSPKVFNYYKYNATLGQVECNDPEDTCNYMICKCDKEATECFYKSLSTYNPSNLNNINVAIECAKGYDNNICLFLTPIKGNLNETQLTIELKDESEKFQLITSKIGIAKIGYFKTYIIE